MMKREKPLPKLYRGENAHVWERRLILQRWPPPAAAALARFLTGQAPITDLDWSALQEPVPLIDHARHGAK